MMIDSLIDKLHKLPWPYVRFEDVENVIRQHTAAPDVRCGEISDAMHDLLRQALEPFMPGKIVMYNDKEGTVNIPYQQYRVLVQAASALPATREPVSGKQRHCLLDDLPPERLVEVDLNTRQPVDYRPHPNTSLQVRIENALHRLNLDRPDIAALKDGQSIQRNIADDRWLAALLIDLRGALMRKSVLSDSKGEKS